MRDEFRNLTSPQQIPVMVMSQEEIKEYLCKKQISEFKHFQKIETRKKLDSV